ncbi:hypothetical protein A6R68_14185 [Neotoma lepida]|uniref:Prohibitin n=1 Tax=Neotoma lepida TaxID=56216 RepID=A0A1A6HCB8_NEOLE|nr:hypothetical protein A6R68_14185 [Neotoma lepida]
MVLKSGQVSPLIRKELAEHTKDFSLILGGVVITDLSFSQEYPAAIETKQMAKQETLWALFLVENAK